MAHYYATPPDEFEMVTEARLPWPTDTSFKWKSTHMALLWPKLLRDLFEERPTIPKPSVLSRRERHVPTIEVVDSDSEEFGEQPPSVRRSRCEPTIVGQPPPAVAKRRRVPTKASKGRQIGVEGDQHRSRETHKPSSTPGPPAPARDGTNEPLRQCGNP